MSDSSTAHSNAPLAVPKLDPQAFKRAWRLVTVAGLGGSLYAMACMMGAPRVKYLTALHATALDFGIIAALGSVAVAFQIVAGLIDTRLRRRKPFWMTVTIIHRLLYLGVLASPALFLDARARVWWIIGVFFVHNCLIHVGSPMWFSWMADLVPRESLNRHWASRQRFITACNIVVSLGMGVLYHYFERRGQFVLGFNIVAGLGILFGIIDILLFSWVPEPPGEREERGRFWQTLIQPLRDREFRPYLIFISYFQFAIMIAGPFCVLYLEESLGLSVLTVQFLLTFDMLGAVFASRLWGLLCDTYGQRPVLQIIVVGKSFIQLTYLLAPRMPEVAVPVFGAAFFFDGMMNSGLALAIQGMNFKATPRRNRTMYIAAVNLLSVGLVGGLAPLLSGALIEAMKDWRWSVGAFDFTGFSVVFGLSAALRLGGAYFAARIREPQSVPARTVLSHFFMRNPLRAVGRIYRLTESLNEFTRARSAKELGRLRSPLAIRGLIHALGDSSRPVRRAAARALGEIGMDEACEPLARALCDPVSGIQSPAARALGHIGGFQSLKVLLGNLRSLDADALNETIDSLARIGDSAAILPLICLFNDVEDRPTRRRIAAALGQLARTESLDDVMAALGPAPLSPVTPTDPQTLLQRRT